MDVSISIFEREIAPFSWPGQRQPRPNFEWPKLTMHDQGRGNDQYLVLPVVGQASDPQLTPAYGTKIEQN